MGVRSRPSDKRKKRNEQGRFQKTDGQQLRTRNERKFVLGVKWEVQNSD